MRITRRDFLSGIGKVGLSMLLPRYHGAPITEDRESLIAWGKQDGLIVPQWNVQWSKAPDVLVPMLDLNMYPRWQYTSSAVNVAEVNISFSIFEKNNLFAPALGEEVLVFFSHNGKLWIEEYGTVVQRNRYDFTIRGHSIVDEIIYGSHRRANEPSR